MSLFCRCNRRWELHRFADTTFPWRSMWAADFPKNVSLNRPPVDSNWMLVPLRFRVLAPNDVAVTMLRKHQLCWQMWYMHSIYADWAADQRIPCPLCQRPAVCRRISNVPGRFELARLHQTGENNRTVSCSLSEWWDKRKINHRLRSITSTKRNDSIALQPMQMKMMNYSFCNTYRMECQCTWDNKNMAFNDHSQFNFPNICWKWKNRRFFDEIHKLNEEIESIGRIIRYKLTFVENFGHSTKTKKLVITNKTR